jgi:hypothetical protein
MKMENKTVRRKRLDAATEALLMKAIEAFFETCQCEVLCDVCGSRIQFIRLSESAWEHRCNCGKFNGTLQGL